MVLLFFAMLVFLLWVELCLLPCGSGVEVSNDNDSLFCLHLFDVRTQLGYEIGGGFVTVDLADAMWHIHENDCTFGLYAVHRYAYKMAFFAYYIQADLLSVLFLNEDLDPSYAP